MSNLSGKNEKRLRELIITYDLIAAEDIILSHAVECASLTLGETETYCDVGNSRYGGVPDLPTSLDWPRSDAGYLSFLMQVNLAELPTVLNNPLPARGILYFFIEEDEACTDVIAQVLFHDGDCSLLSRADPPPTELIAQELYTDLKPHIIHPQCAIDLLSYGSEIYDRVEDLTEITDSDNGGERYFQLIDDAIGKSNDVSIVGQILGFSSQLNDDMRENAHLAHTGNQDKIYDYTYRQNRQGELLKAAEEWRLLWRIDSDFSVGVCIWDAGSYFITIRCKDLEEWNFKSIYTEIVTG